jgi:hypothetical protein
MDPTFLCFVKLDTKSGKIVGELVDIVIKNQKTAEK